MNRISNKEDDRLFQSTVGDEGSMLLIHAYYLRSLPRRHLTTMPETEETTVDNKSESTNICDDDVCGIPPGEYASPDTSSKNIGPLSASVQRGEIHADFPPRNYDPLSTRQRNTDDTQSRNSVYSSKRMRLLIFIKIILKCLDNDDPSLHLKAKKIVTDCTRKNREGVPGFIPLADVITRQLRITVGEVHWNRAKRLMEYYLKKRVEKPQSVEH